MKSTYVFIIMAILISMLCGSESKPAGDFENLCICPKIYKPVCASNNKTYSNLCLMDCAKGLTRDLTLKRDGRCQPDDGKDELKPIEVEIAENK
ncbi:hypothetical protein GN156_20855 [bacterium LRH843]|uniref:Serine protease inhibitor dipetalogastin n=1 Tax=Nilaparvata lugens TaxID=108931 RepID=A0A220XIF4_NILLU|nr:serine protease inhibitor dipetalogastin [Nilaparvata lugens]NEU33143.1 hypothetical protein [bacterium LRH843]